VAKYAAKPGAGDGPKAAARNPHLAAQLESIDEGVGMILATLRELGLERNTLVVFTSDNGGARGVTSNAPLRAGKGTLYEGGIRVPLVARWPAGAVDGGRVSDVPTVTMDLYPTLLAAAGVRVPGEATDGASVLPVLQGRAAARGRDTLYWHYPLDARSFPNRPSASAVRAGALKLVDFFDRDSVELYDLSADPGEQRDLAGSRPADAARLRTQLAAWRRALRTDTLTLPTGR
jgi:arylsulfatase A-like enzyme